MWQDVSRLVDLCRQSIYFESIANIITCLAAICGDKDVALARVRNRLDPSFDSSQSAGYRNLAINLRLVSSEATRLGVEGHVCEIQLLLASMAVIKVTSLRYHHSNQPANILATEEGLKLKNCR